MAGELALSAGQIPIAASPKSRNCVSHPLADGDGRRRDLLPKLSALHAHS
ncbi:MAG: hypothetical protein J7551_01310 [Chloroflexi bacterium]|nr:hypothetical protein [Chloroflexota bacterium]